VVSRTIAIQRACRWRSVRGRRRRHGPGEPSFPRGRDVRRSVSLGCARRACVTMVSVRSMSVAWCVPVRLLAAALPCLDQPRWQLHPSQCNRSTMLPGWAALRRLSDRTRATGGRIARRPSLRQPRGQPASSRPSEVRQRRTSPAGSSRMAAGHGRQSSMGCPGVHVQRDIGEPEPTSSSAAQSPNQSELGSAPISDCAGAQAWAIANVSILKRRCASPSWLVSQIALVPRYPKGFWVPG